MPMITLDTARTIMKQIEVYNGPMNAQALIESIDFPPDVVTQVIEFLQECRGELKILPAPAPAPVIIPDIDDTPLDLMNELQYNYKIAKRVLQTSLVGDRTIDAEETRKSLRTISAFMEQALKLQERLYNAQQIQKFQDAVLDTIATVDPVYRNTILERLNEQ